MKYRLVKKAETAEEIDSALFCIISYPEIYHCDSILETEDRIIIRYLKEANLLKGLSDTILYIHFSKTAQIFTKICIYALEEPAK